MKVLAILVGVVVLAVAASAFFYFTNSNVPVLPAEVTPVASATPTASPTPEPTVTPTPTLTPSPSQSAGLTVYKNSKYGFEISYPKPYKVLDTASDLGAYPNGIALLYTGGQAYDIVIEIWDTKGDYETSYGSRVSDLTVFESTNKFITVLNNTGTPENKTIIASFNLL